MIDRKCTDAGDQFACSAIRCWALAGMSDDQIALRARHMFGDPPHSRYDAAETLVRHAAIFDVPARKSRRLLVWLSRHIPGLIDDDPDELYSLMAQHFGAQPQGARNDLRSP